MQTKITRAMVPAGRKERIEGSPLHIGSHATAVIDEQYLDVIAPGSEAGDNFGSLVTKLAPAGGGYVTGMTLGRIPQPIDLN